MLVLTENIDQSGLYPVSFLLHDCHLYNAVRKTAEDGNQETDKQLKQKGATTPNCEQLNLTYYNLLFHNLNLELENEINF